jgi:hypothetical protein
VITSAFQLFGEWTFGGKRIASLDSQPPTPDSVKWRDGYHALQTLDHDRNGVLQGDELTPLGLWFDANRDGISQSGEVRSVSTSGVTKLFVTPDRIDELSRSVHASIGYERIVDGRPEIGPSVDWYGKAAASAAELANGLLAAPKLCDSPDQQSTGPGSRGRLADRLPVRTSGGSSPYAAIRQFKPTVWYWKNTPDVMNMAKDAGGFLVFSEQPDGTITGDSYAIIPPRSGDAAGLTAVVVLPLEGKSISGEAITFTINGFRPGEGVRSAAIFSPDGGSIDGKTVAKIEIDGRISEFTYRWHAKPLPGTRSTTPGSPSP